MAAIRIPERATPLLPFCRSYGSNGPHIWETYADLVVFLASYGYAQEGDRPETIVPAKSTNPIDLATFRNRGLYPQLLMLAIAYSRNWIIAKELDGICNIVEGLAATGANLLGPVVNASSAVTKTLLSELTSSGSHPRSVLI